VDKVGLPIRARFSKNGSRFSDRARSIKQIHRRAIARFQSISLRIGGAFPLKIQNGPELLLRPASVRPQISTLN
jgi:hypothetical protein